MKTKKTIRTKLNHRPLTRQLAKLQRDLHSLERRMDKLIEFAQEIETEGRTLARENVGLRERLTVAELPPEERPIDELPPETTTASRLADSKTTIGGKASDGTDCELWPELPNGEGVEMSPAKMCKCGHFEGDHGTRGANCCRVNCPCEGFEDERRL